MKPQSMVTRIIAVPLAAIALLLLGIIGVSYYDVSASVGSSSVTLVSLRPDAIHVLVLHWRVGQYHAELDMAGQYVDWTLQPFRKVHWFK